jgi:hypothetical protein
MVKTVNPTVLTPTQYKFLVAIRNSIGSCKNQDMKSDAKYIKIGLLT